MFMDKTSSNRHKQEIEHLKKLGCKLTITNRIGGCCQECAKYGRRIYSIDGTDKRFPIVPEYECTCPGISFLFWQEGISDTHFPTEDYVEYSNRPFIDDRTEEEKRNYLHFLDRQVYDSVVEKDKKDYCILKSIIPDDLPKSFSAYRRMKNENTKKFKEISNKASILGIDISLTDEEATTIKRYLNRVKETGFR